MLVAHVKKGIPREGRRTRKKRVVLIRGRRAVR